MKDEATKTSVKDATESAQAAFAKTVASMGADTTSLLAETAEKPAKTAGKTASKAAKGDKAADKAKAALRKSMAETTVTCPVCGASARAACRDLHVTESGTHYMYKCPKGCAFGSIDRSGKMTGSKAAKASWDEKVPTVAPEGWIFVKMNPAVHIW